jgi:Transposase DDE domain group 1
MWYPFIQRVNGLPICPVSGLTKCAGGEGRRPSCSTKTIVLNIDSSESPNHGEQEGSAYNGHFGCTCDHPLFVFNQFGDVERCALRPGNVHSADGWRALLEPVIARYRGIAQHLYFRGDAAKPCIPSIKQLPSHGTRYSRHRRFRRNIHRH